MERITETETHIGKALFVQDSETPFSNELLKALEKYDLSMRHSKDLPSVIHSLEYLFLFKHSYTKSELEQVLSLKHTHVMFVTFSEKMFTFIEDLLKNHPHGKSACILVSPQDTREETVERTLWFMLSHSSESSLRLISTLEPHIHKKMQKKPSLKINVTKRRVITAIVFFILLLHTVFLIPLGLTSWYAYSGAKQLAAHNDEGAKQALSQAHQYHIATKATYVLAEPGLKFLFISYIPNNALSINENALTLLETALEASQQAHELLDIIAQPNISPEQSTYAKDLVQKLQKEIVTLQNTSQSLYDRLDYQHPKIQHIRSQMEEVLGILDTMRVLSAHLPSLLADGTSKHYSVFFYNNMEIRPGGGFIGSFADVVMENYSLKRFTVYDVYDADGKLTTHVRPPAPIREILHQPHWFLRDSNFDPDFTENIQAANFFLENELQLKDFHGSIGITTTALTYILEAFDEVYIADFDDTITADNFYLKTQSQAENSFFPGSIQKKSFLSTVGKTLMMSAGKASPRKLASSIRTSLDEKHIVMNVKDKALQRDIDQLGWGGKILNPQCIEKGKHCIVNHILPVEANLGVNKANFFVNKLMKLSSHIGADGTITNEFSVAFTNNSSVGIAPGGTYTNYFQVYIPVDAHIKSVDLDATPLYDYTVSKSGIFKIAAYLLSIPPGSTHIFTISYELNEKFNQGENIYQVVLQKQIGAFNSDFTLDITYDPRILLVDQNFKSVAKNHSVLYNSSLSTNKVFVTEFIKQ